MRPYSLSGELLPRLIFDLSSIRLLQTTFREICITTQEIANESIFREKPGIRSGPSMSNYNFFDSCATVDMAIRYSRDRNVLNWEIWWYDSISLIRCAKTSSTCSSYCTDKTVHKPGEWMWQPSMIAFIRYIDIFARIQASDYSTWYNIIINPSSNCSAF